MVRLFFQLSHVRFHTSFVQWVKLQNKFIWNYTEAEFVVFSLSLVLSYYLVIASVTKENRVLLGNTINFCEQNKTRVAHN